MEFIVCSSNEGLTISKVDTPTAVHISPETLSIKRVSLSRQVIGQPCYAVIGLLQFKNSKYLLLVSQAEKVGVFRNSAIYKVTGVDSVTLGVVQEPVPLKMMTDLLMQGFYFSYDLNLTRSLGAADTSVDSRYFWNEHALKPFLQAGATEFIVPLINGFVEFKQLGQWNLGIVSRRDKRRPGPRYFARGVDDSGVPANYLETEQVLESPDKSFHFVQIRGSVPVVWQQRPNLTLAPPVSIASITHSARHFSELCKTYPSVLVVNLLNKKKHEGALGEAFHSAVQVFNSEQLQWCWFEYNKKCGMRNFRALQELFTELQPVTWTEVCENSIKRVQDRIIRTNCLDSLDRTNLVQNFFALEVLKQQGQNCPEAEAACRLLWADNGDALSQFYAGTPAQKADVTRTGRRTVKGLLTDGTYALRRLVVNNFLDGHRQNARDLFLGNIEYSKVPWRGTQLALFTAATTASAVVCYHASQSEAFKSNRWAGWAASIACAVMTLRLVREGFINKPLAER